MRVVLSSCLLSLKCRYDAEKKEIPEFLKSIIKNNPDIEIMAICPEFSYFQKAPRDKIMFNKERTIIFEDGTSFEKSFSFVLQDLVSYVRKFNPDFVILKEKSPSCGLHTVFIKDLGWKNGCGKWAEILKKNIKADFFNEDGLCG